MLAPGTFPRTLLDLHPQVPVLRLLLPAFLTQATCLRALASLVEDGVQFPALSCGSQASIAPVPGDPTAFWPPQAQHL